MPKIEPKAKKTSLNFNPTAAASTSQLCLFVEADQPKVSVEPVLYWPGRFTVKVQQADQIWQLCPALSDLDALDLLQALQQAGVSFELDPGGGGPVKAAQIHAIAESFIERLEVKQ